jgi:nucleoside triphosphate pyrophosphatase
LRRLVADFVVMPAEIEERLEPGPLPGAIARLAEAKARAVLATGSHAVVLGADTMVVVDGLALGKPGDAAEALAMLRRLRGRQHEVMTGVSVVDSARDRAWAATEVSRVVMARYPDELIERYVASGAPLDKAGSYAVQDAGGLLVDAIVGSYTNVVGLPLALTARLLEAADVAVSAWS